MNANPSSAASVAPALQPTGVRAPEQAPAIPTTLETFEVYQVSLDACRSCSPIAALLGANLRDQLRRASSSAVLNTAEGFGSRSRGVKRRHYEIARGSAIECIAVIDLVSALGMMAGSTTELASARTLFTRVAMMLSKLEARFRSA